MIFENNKIYDTLKFISLAVFPISEFILTVGNLCGLINAPVVAGIVSAVGVLCAGLVKVSSDMYHKTEKEG